MTIAIKDEQIVKRDEKGRLRITKERREALLAEYDQGGMTGAAFARWAGIPYATFMTWLHKRRKATEPVVEKEARQAVTLEWVEAVVEKSAEVPKQLPKRETAAKSGMALVVEGPGVRLELSEERHVLWAAKLLRHLGEVC